MHDTDTPPVDLTPEKPKSGEHPFWEDLNPDFLAGENYGEQGPHPEKSAPTAYDVKDVHDRYRQLTDDDLKQIPIIPAGSRLEQGATYANLSDEQPREFTATGDMVTGGYDRLVLKSSVAYWVWNRLIGVNSRERLDESGNG